MRRHSTLLVAAIAVLALAASGGVAATDATAATGDTAAAVDGQQPTTTVVTTDNLTAIVEVPPTIAANVTQNFSVDVSGATGNVTAEWTFEGESTRTGQTVQYAFSDGGNATIAVTVTDESGQTVTRELVVDVVDYGDQDESSNPLKNVATIALWGVLAAAILLVPLLYVVPKTMQVLSDAL